MGTARQDLATSSTILDAVFKIVTGLIVMAVGWTANEIFDLRAQDASLSERVSIIENTRYTREDALDFERTVSAHQSTVDSRLLKIEEILRRVEEKVTNE